MKKVLFSILLSVSFFSCIQSSDDTEEKEKEQAELSSSSEGVSSSSEKEVSSSVSSSSEDLKVSSATSSSSERESTKKSDKDDPTPTESSSSEDEVVLSSSEDILFSSSSEIDFPFSSSEIDFPSSSSEDIFSSSSVEVDPLSSSSLVIDIDYREDVAGIWYSEDPESSDYYIFSADGSVYYSVDADIMGTGSADPFMRMEGTFEASASTLLLNFSDCQMIDMNAFMESVMANEDPDLSLQPTPCIELTGEEAPMVEYMILEPGVLLLINAEGEERIYLEGTA